MEDKEKILTEKAKALLDAVQEHKCSALVLVTGDAAKENQVMQMLGSYGNLVNITWALAEAGKQNNELARAISAAASILLGSK